jgi:chromosome partitioning protein
MASKSSWIVAFIGQKGGSGKSRLAQAFATALTTAGADVLIADMDRGPQGSLTWSEVRARAGWHPPVRVMRIERTDLRLVLGKADLVVLDTAGFADRITRELAELSNLVVVPVGTDLGDWQSTVDTLHQLANAGVPLERLVPAIVRASSEGKAELARDYLRRAGYEPLKHVTYYSANYHDAFNVGKAMVEAASERAREEASGQVNDILNALQRAQKREAERGRVQVERDRTKDRER